MSPKSAEERATRAVNPTPDGDGDSASVGAVAVRHRFVTAPGAVDTISWHVVEAGDPSGETVLLIHGHPFSWAYWRPLIEYLGASHHVLAVDLKGYGQSDKRFGDWRVEQIAEELAALCDVLGLSRLNLIANDRGTVVCDHFVSAHPGRLLRYVRVGAPNENELEGDHDYEAWHREPLWAPDMLRDTARYMVGIVEPQFAAKIDEMRWTEMLAQFAFGGIEAAVPRSFQQSSFRKDREDRRERLFPAIKCPVLDLRGDSMSRYVPLVSDSRTTLAGWQEQTVAGSGPYAMLDAPAATIAMIKNFLASSAAAGADPIVPAAPAFVPTPSKPSGIPLIVNADGEEESIEGVTVTHRFVEADGLAGPVRWHYVEAGDPSNETIVMLHGHPESWYGWRNQIARFAATHHIIAPDLKGYGQSDKRPGDFRHEAVAEELIALFDKLGLTRFNLFAHDRGAVQADYIGGNHPARVLRYVRMQQISHMLLPTNSPQEKIFRDPVAAPKLFRDSKAIFDRMWQRFKMEPVAKEHFDRMVSEVSHPGFSDAVPRYFQSSSFQKELYDRLSRLFRNMTFPVLALQAGEDVGQPRWYYDDSSRPLSDHIRDLRVEFIDGAGHFTTINFPGVLTDRIADFLATTDPQEV